MVRTPEGLEKDAICKYLDTIGSWYCKPVMTGYGKSGIPDIVACISGKFISIEVKREGKAPTILQTRRIEEIVKAGGLALWGTAEKVIGELRAMELVRAAQSRSPVERHERIAWGSYT